MNLQEIVLARPPLQLSHSLDERRTLNIAYGASKLNNTHIWCLIGVIDGDASHALDPILNCVREVRNNLDGLAKVVAATLALDNVLVDLAGGDVVLAREGDV